MAHGERFTREQLLRRMFRAKYGCPYANPSASLLRSAPLLYRTMRGGDSRIVSAMPAASDVLQSW
eukprot:CAMPEP_0177796312 /NCGR_PEP_ID=MMETSP0491_2-20121128/26712_1 /TAXON_ID=63592 /ORGANISM="Tetraselmis chuii, Strain PLY429" /LENGTH=64 /DNA_ID=CAMNT_0019319227 /DNA_START=180 /DNA_END=374 /DNA_ORIENTATION=-